ncbi:arylsulfatase [bacterium]|jgi:arylsulfatase A-like enzyme|nr:arylsulfatase [bacterium]
MKRCTGILAIGSLLLGAAIAGERPNVVLILADDMGYGDVQVLNEESKIPTPHLNGLAKGGAIFTDAHSGSAVCTPTRYGLMTGRYCWRSRLKRGVLFPPNDKPLIENDRVTIASFLKEQGYRTGMVGKWHLGIGWARDEKGKVVFDEPFTDGPIEKGFEEWYGVAASLDMVPYVMLRNHQAIAKTTGTQEAMDFPKYVRKGPKDSNFDPGDALDLFAEEAEKFIKKKDGKPFFLYLPLTGPHKPVWPHERFVGKTELGPYGDFVHQVDATVGMVLKSLEESGKAENTIVVYTSDNGSFMFRRWEKEDHHLKNIKDQGYRPEDHSANYHWRGTKADVWEGGHRVPFFVRWPKEIKAGARVEDAVCLTDVLATVADIVGSKLPKGAGEDSYSFAPQLKGEKGVERPGVINHSASGTFAIRKGPWKLVLGDGSGGRQKPKGKAFGKPYHLYHLGDDPSEAHNLIEQKGEIAKEMEAEFEKIVGKDR